MSEPDSFDPRAFHAQFDIAMIVACDRNGVIGHDGDLPWHLPGDLKHFMRSTKGCPVLMGRKTYASLDKPLPARLNIVVSHSMDDPGVEGVVVVRDLDAAKKVAGNAIRDGSMQGPIWIAGGGTIYRQMLDEADLVVRTAVDADVDGDAHFPSLNQDSWERVRDEFHPADDRHKYGYTIEWWIERE